MTGFNLSALAVRERAVTLFLILAVAIAGIYAFLKLGRAEDPSFTIKVLTVTAAWPGATAQEMQDLVAEPLEKRLQELRWYDRILQRELHEGEAGPRSGSSLIRIACGSSACRPPRQHSSCSSC
jgi:AcrB/AcrD/AcrF family